MTRLESILSPRDGMFCKDGRGWNTSSSGRSGSLSWPFPSTVMGALRTGWGYALRQKLQLAMDAIPWDDSLKQVTDLTMIPFRCVFGEEWQQEHRMWPVPTDALYMDEEANVLVLNPTSNPSDMGSMGLPSNPMDYHEKTQYATNSGRERAREALWRPRVKVKGKPIASPSWWTEENFVNWLLGITVKKQSKEEKKALELSTRHQTHLRIDPSTQVTVNSSLFSTEIVETLGWQPKGNRKSLTKGTETKEPVEWAIGVACQVADLNEVPTFLEKPLYIGGKRRHLLPLQREELQQGAVGDLFSCPARLVQGWGDEVKGLRLVVVTPTHFERGWLPDGFSVVEGSDEFRGSLPELEGEVILRAALCGRPTHVSGWDMKKKQPKKTKRLVAPGTTYFFEKVDGGSFSVKEMKALWLASWGQDVLDGFGRIVPGRWEIQR